jgi:hypothetical protein
VICGGIICFNLRSCNREKQFERKAHSLQKKLEPLCDQTDSGAYTGIHLSGIAQSSQVSKVFVQASVISTPASPGLPAAVIRLRVRARHPEWVRLAFGSLKQGRQAIVKGASGCTNLCTMNLFIAAIF